MEKTGIQEAVEIAERMAQVTRAISGGQGRLSGGCTYLGRLLGVSRQVVRQWLDAGFVPYGRARQIEHHTGVDRRRLVDPVIRDLFA